jgi:S1-C subfamily serine protease
MIRISICFVGLLSLSIVEFARGSSVGDCVAIQFVSENCPQCKNMSQAVERAIHEGWVIRQVDVRDDPTLASRWQINTTPTTILLRNGREVDRLLGAVTHQELTRRLLGASSPDRIRESLGQTTDRIVRNQSPPVPSREASGMVTKSNPSDSLATIQPNGGRQSSLASTRNPQSAVQMAQQATVRIRVEDTGHDSVGTGTIIDTVNGEALVLTCGHVFRDASPQAKIVVDTYFDGVAASFPASLIDFQAAEMDIGLIAFHAGRPVPFVPLIPHSVRLREGEAVFSIGCDHGQNPSTRKSQISKLNRYLGEPNVEVSGAPVPGRSGGGLFNEIGELIGVCYAADSELDEGLYNAPDVVYKQLSRLGLQRLYDRPRENGPEKQIASNARVQAQAQSNAAIDAAAAGLTVVMRDQTGKEQRIQVANPSPQLMQAIVAEGRSISR